MERVTFQQLAECEIGENKFLVISKRSDGEYSISQRVVAHVDGKEVSFFMKGAWIVDEQKLEAIGQMFNFAVGQV